MNTLRQVRAFFISSAFTDNTRLILAKNQEKAKQHPEADYSEYNEYKYLSMKMPICIKQQLSSI